LEIPPIIPNSQPCYQIDSNGPIYNNNGSIIGTIRYSYTSVKNEMDIYKLSALVTISFNDDYESSLSWVVTWSSLT
jgi:hypothetical protein